MRLQLITILSALMFPLSALAQMGILNQQVYFRHSIPKGNYSGITHLSGSRYAVVNDKPASDGFSIFNIEVDSITGEINDAWIRSTLSSDRPGTRDGEGIAYFPGRNTIFISGEADNSILEYNMDGSLTGRFVHIPADVNIPFGNYGLESLTYNAHTHRFWTTTESTLPVDGQQANSVNGIANHLRLMSFDDSLRYLSTLNYVMDVPLSTSPSLSYAMGVSDLCALDDGDLLVLEREAFVPKARLGAWVVNKVYRISTSDKMSPVRKHLVAMWRTRFNLLHKDFANYEGMCLGPKLVDGRQTIILCADSQNQYGGLLRDWFRTIVLSE